jgi:hypothetical protein
LQVLRYVLVEDEYNSSIDGYDEHLPFLH